MKTPEKIYFEGLGCTCAAWCQGECGCDADWTPKMEQIVNDWKLMSAAELRERCGYITDNEIKVVRTVLYAIAKINEHRPSNQEILAAADQFEIDRLKAESDIGNGVDIS